MDEDLEKSVLDGGNMKHCDFTELKHDFKELLSTIDFKAYNPFSKTFMKALFIGQMIMATKCVCEDYDVQDELDGAEKYFEMYKETSDVQYKEMASDELRHAGILIKKHLSKTTDDSEKEKLNLYEKDRQDMLKSISVYSKESSV